MSLNDAVHWSTSLGGGTTVALVQAGTFLTDAGAVFGPVPRLLWERHVAAELTADHRLVQALNCLLVETPAGRVLVETGIGERTDDKLRDEPRLRRRPDPAGARPGGLRPGDGRRRGDEPPPFRPCRRPARRRRAGGPSRGRRIVAQRAEWEIALGDNPRLVASYDQPELRLVRDWGAEGWAEGEREILPGVSVVPTGGHSAGHQAIVVRGGGPGGRTLAFFGDLAMRPWSANPKWVTAFDDFPLNSVLVKGELFARAAAEDWSIVLSHERLQPVGRLVADRDRYAFEPD